MKVIEQLLIQSGISPIAGVDEAGRGACAGPLVIAAVVLKDPFAPELAESMDSKTLSGPCAAISALQKKCPGSIHEKRMARASNGVKNAGVCMYIRRHVKSGE